MKLRFNSRRRSGSAKHKVLVGLLVFVGIFWLSPGGWLAVHNACEKNGGYEMNSSVFAEGYVLEDGSAAMCGTCIRDVGNGLFEFVYVARRSADSAGDEKGTYDRYSISTRGDPACHRVEKGSILNRIAQSTRLKGTECIAISESTSPPDYIFRYEARRLRSWFGVSYYVNQYVVTGNDSDEPLAAFRHYGHIPLVYKIFTDRAEPLWSCETESPRFNPVVFRVTVLRDKNKVKE